jgi:hypothetical protein
MNEKIRAALSVLELPERASVKQIKTQYKKLIHQWHPDKYPGNQAECHEKTVRLIESYKLLMEYCENFSISFEEIETETREEFWERRFGNDPLWGKPREKAHEK